MPIKAYIRKNNGDKPDDYAGIILPATTNELHSALAKLSFRPEDIDRCTVEDITAVGISGKLAEYLTGSLSLIAIDKLNYLAAIIGNVAVDKLAQQKLSAIFEWAESSQPSFPGHYHFDGDSIDDVINIVMNMDYFIFTPDIYHDEDLGKLVIQAEIATGKRSPDSVGEDFDYEDYASEYAEKENGVFLGHCFISGSSFIPYMEMDNALPQSSRIWREAVINFLPEDQRHKDYEYFRPQIDYEMAVNGETGVLSFDLAAKIEDFCRSARLQGFNYDESDIVTRGRTIIEFAAMCESRDKRLFDTLDSLLAASDAGQSVDTVKYESLKAEFHNLDQTLEKRARAECMSGYYPADKEKIKSVLAAYPEKLKHDTGFIALLVYRNIYKDSVAILLNRLGKADEKMARDSHLFQLLPSDVQVRLEMEHNLFHQYTQTHVSHRNKVIALYDAKIQDRVTQAMAKGKITAFPVKKKPSLLGDMRKTEKSIPKRPDTPKGPDKNKKKPGRD